MDPTAPSPPSAPSEPAPKPTLLVAAPVILVLHAVPFLIIGLVRYRDGGSGAGSVLMGTVRSPVVEALEALGILALGAILLVAAWGFWADRLWARPLVLAYGLIATAASLLYGALSSALWMAVVTSFLGSYLYDATSAVGYYARLEEEDQRQPGRNGRAP